MGLRRVVCCLLTAVLIGLLSVPAFAKEPVRVVVTVFPAYDWTMQILGDDPGNMEVTWLFDNGVDPHSYQPSMEDILKIANCDLFVYVGGESDRWVEDALSGVANPDMRVINLLDVLGENVREEELVEGMQSDEECETEETEYDEHVWLSLRNAQLFCETIAAALAELDPDHAGDYEEHADAYIEQLQELDQAYVQMVSKAPGDTILVADRFPFRYLTDDYGLNYYAAFAGCSAETEASFETIIFLAQKADELGLDVILTIDGSDQKIAETVVQSTASKDQEILTLDSLQSVSKEDVQAGENYLAVMEENLEVLEEALCR